MRYSNAAIPDRPFNVSPTGPELEQQRAFATKVNYGFEKVERLQGNIGYVDIRGFMPPEIGGETAAAAAELAGEGTPIDDHRASARYRSAMLEQALLKFWAQHAPAPDPEVSR